MTTWPNPIVTKVFLLDWELVCRSALLSGVDAYEIPASLREQLQLRYPADVFPYAAAADPSTSTTPSPT
jgi:hypothetical protein